MKRSDKKCQIKNAEIFQKLLLQRSTPVPWPNANVFALRKAAPLSQGTVDKICNIRLT